MLTGVLLGEAATSPPPHLVLIVADDLGKSVVSAIRIYLLMGRHKYVTGY